MTPEISVRQAIHFSWEMLKRHFTFFLFISTVFYCNGVALSGALESFELNLFLTICQLLVVLVALRASLAFYQGKSLQWNALFPSVVTIYRIILATLIIAVFVAIILLLSGYAGSKALQIAADLPQSAGLPFNAHWILLYVLSILGTLFVLARVIFVYFLIIDQNSEVVFAFQVAIQISRHTSWKLFLIFLACLLYADAGSVLFTIISYLVCNGMPRLSDTAVVQLIMRGLDVCKILAIYPIILGVFTSLYQQLRDSYVKSPFPGK